MKPSDDRLRELFDRAVELNPEEQERFLIAEAGGDPALLNELRELLASDEAARHEEVWNQSALEAEALRASADDDREIGKVVGAYRQVELIGKGGMGNVYRAVRIDEEFEKNVAVKQIRVGLDGGNIVARFRAERKILAGLEHPNIARLLDGGAGADGLPYLIMEYIEGVPPLEFCEKNRLTVPQRLALFRQVCAAVHYAHQRMVIHRDLKPGNILVTAEGVPKLLDFGIAKVVAADQTSEPLTETGASMMTVRYSSPEQVRGETVTTASDLYSLGVILYELLTGRSPYGDQNRPPHELALAVCNEDPPKPGSWNKDLRGDLDNILLKTLRKNPAERYASVDQFSEDLLRYLDGRPVQARSDSAWYVARKFLGRHRAVSVAAAVVLCIAIGAFIAIAQARARAERRFNDVRRLAHSVMFDYSDAIDKLPGATPVRARLVKDALTYLDDLSKEADTPELRREIVNAYAHVSNVQGDEYENNLGDTAGALVSARKSVEEAEKLLKQDRTPPSLNAAALAFATQGALLYSKGDLAAAEPLYERSIELYREIASLVPRDLDNEVALSSALRQMGDLCGGVGLPNLGKTKESLDYYEQAKALSAEMVAHYPGNVDAVKQSYKVGLRLSQKEWAAGLREKATEDLRETLRQIEKVDGASPNDANVKLEFANAEVQFGNLLADAGNSAEAVQHMAKSIEVLRKLSAADPGNAMFRRGQYIVESDWGRTLRVYGQAKEAVVHNERAVALARALAYDSPASEAYRSDVGIQERRLSDALLAAGDAASALQHANEAQSILCASAAGGRVDPYTGGHCGRTYLTRGNARLALRDTTGAVSDFREAEKIAGGQSKAQPSNAITRSDWARALAGLAAGLAASNDLTNARKMYEGALEQWSILRQSKSITAEDTHRSEDAARALEKLKAGH